MNRERHKFWESYIRDVQKRMLLAHWNVVLEREPTDIPGACASVEILDGRHEARIRLREGFDRYTPVEQRHFVVHELVHLHLAPLAYHLERQGGWKKGEENERERISRGHSSHEEYAVDDLARIIAPSMPLPPKVKA